MWVVSFVDQRCGVVHWQAMWIEWNRVFQPCPHARTHYLHSPSALFQIWPPHRSLVCITAADNDPFSGHMHHEAKSILELSILLSVICRPQVSSLTADSVRLEDVFDHSLCWISLLP